MKTETITVAEDRFLRMLARGNWKLRDGKATPRIQSLIDRGYCRTSKERLGPLGIYTGDVSLLLTEAGQAAIEHDHA